MLHQLGDMPSAKQLGKLRKYRFRRIFYCATVVDDDDVRHAKILFSDNSIELLNRPGIYSSSDSPTRKQNALGKKEFIGEVPPK
jgi:hypothetical protein